MKEQKTYNIRGVIHSGINYDVDKVITAYSFKQARLKYIFMLKQQRQFSKASVKDLYILTKNLDIIEIK